MLLLHNCEYPKRNQAIHNGLKYDLYAYSHNIRKTLQNEESSETDILQFLLKLFLFHIIFPCFFLLKLSGSQLSKQTSSIFICKSQFWEYLRSQAKLIFHMTLIRQNCLASIYVILENSVQLKMVWLMHTWGMLFTSILFHYFQRYFNSEAIASCVPKDLILKTSNDDGHSLNAVLDLWHLALYLVRLALQTYVDKKGIDYYWMFGCQNTAF